MLNMSHYQWLVDRLRRGSGSEDAFLFAMRLPCDCHAMRLPCCSSPSTSLVSHSRWLGCPATLAALQAAQQRFWSRSRRRCMKRMSSMIPNLMLGGRFYKRLVLEAMDGLSFVREEVVGVIKRGALMRTMALPP